MQAWEYAIIVPDEVDAAEAFLRGLLVAESLGWCARFPADPTAPDGMNLPTATSRDELVRSVGHDGGLVSLWHGERDIALSWNPNDNRTLGFVYTGNFHEYMTFEASALDGLFRHLCTELKPDYGYSSDDYLLYQFEPQPDIPWAAHLGAIRSRLPPPLLLWLNYFSKEYFHNCVKRHLLGLQHEIVQDSGGVFLYLALAPWGARIAELSASAYRLRAS